MLLHGTALPVDPMAKILPGSLPPSQLAAPSLQGSSHATTFHHDESALILSGGRGHRIDRLNPTDPDLIFLLWILSAGDSVCGWTAI